MPERGTGESQCQRLAGASMYAQAKRKTGRMRPLQIKTVRLRVSGRITVGSGQYNEDGITRLHGLSGNDAIGSDETAGVLDRGIKTRDFRDKAIEQIEVGSDLPIHIGIGGEGKQADADQSGGGFVSL